LIKQVWSVVAGPSACPTFPSLRGVPLDDEAIPPLVLDGLLRSDESELAMTAPYLFSVGVFTNRVSIMVVGQETNNQRTNAKLQTFKLYSYARRSQIQMFALRERVQNVL